MFQKIILISYILIVSCVYPLVVLGAMQSSNYKISFDAIDASGGLSNSTSFGMESTMGEVATGQATSTNYMMRAGYQQMDTSYISLSSPSDVTLSAISGLTGGVSNGSIVWTVTTNSDAGYSLTVKSDTSPALKGSGGAHFDDYTPSSAPDFAFSILSTTSAFGFSPEGTDIVSTYRDDGSDCNTGSGDTTDACWDGFSTTDKVISEGTGPNMPDGVDTTLKLRAKVGTSKIQDSGAYTATIIATAVAL